MQMSIFGSNFKWHWLSQPTFFFAHAFLECEYFLQLNTFHWKKNPLVNSNRTPVQKYKLLSLASKRHCSLHKTEKQLRRKWKVGKLGKKKESGEKRSGKILNPVGWRWPESSHRRTANRWKRQFQFLSSPWKPEDFCHVGSVSQRHLGGIVCDWISFAIALLER